MVFYSVLLVPSSILCGSFESMLLYSLYDKCSCGVLLCFFWYQVGFYVVRLLFCIILCSVLVISTVFVCVSSGIK